MPGVTNAKRSKLTLPGVPYRLVIPLLFLTVPALFRSQTIEKDQPLAEVNGEVISAVELEKAVAAQLARLQEQIYHLKRKKLETLVDERLLAKEAAKQRVSKQALLESEVSAKTPTITEAEVDTFYQENKTRLKGEEAPIKEKIRIRLLHEKTVARRQAFLQYLRSQAQIVVYLKPPSEFRAEVDVIGAPFRGPAAAAVTIVEFSDFLCSYCKQVEPVLTQVLSRYGNKVKLVHKDFPTDTLHPTARQAAEASQCANDQGKFWTYREKLYTEWRDANSEKLNALAEEAGLDLSAFERCLSTRKHQTTVEKDVEDGTRVGVEGTPAFFVNGRMLSGAQPLESFVHVIDEELARQR